MPTFKGVLAFDPSDAISLGMIPTYEPVGIDDEPRGSYSVDEGSGTYEAYPGRLFPVANFVYTSHPLDLENATIDSSTNILSKRFNFVIDFTWYRVDLFELGNFKINISVIAVGRDQDKRTNTDSVFYVNANSSESISVSLRPSFPNVSEQEAASIVNYVGDVGLSPSSRRLLPANVIRIYTRVLGSVYGNEINYSGVTFEQIFANVDVTSDPAFFASGVTFLPYLKTGFQIANADTSYNVQFSVSQEDLDNGIIFNDCIGVRVSIGDGVGKVVCVTRDPVEIPEYQKRRVGYGVTYPWEGYWTGGIDGQYVVNARPLHYSLQFESGVDDKFMGALNAPAIRYGGSTDNDIYYNCPRFSYTRVKNSFIIVFIPKSEAISGFSFYISAHIAEDVSLYAMRIDSMMLINNTGVVIGNGDFLFTPQNYYIRSGILIKNWLVKRTIDSNLLNSDPLSDIPAFSSGVVSEYARPLGFSDIVIYDRSLDQNTSVDVSVFKGMRLAKTRVQAHLPRLQRFPMGYFAAADFFTTDFDGNNKIDGGIAYIDKNGNVDILLPKNNIRDQQWFSTYFGGLTINPIVEQEYYLDTGNDGGYVFLYFDVSAVCNGILGDNDKIPYDHRLAKALSEVSIYSSESSITGVGICQLNFLIKRSTGSWTPREDSMVKDPPVGPFASNEVDLNNYYYDLSSAKFDISTPMPKSMRAEIGQVSVSQRIGNGSIPASINAIFEWFPLSPVNLKSRGRIYFEKTNPVSGFTGQNSEVNVPYILTKPTSGKIASCIDFHGLNGALISAGSFGGSELRAIHIDGKLEVQKRRLLVDDMSFPSNDVRTDWYDRTRPCWYGFAVDQIPIESRGSLVIRQRKVGESSSDNPSMSVSSKLVKSNLQSRNINFYNYTNGRWYSGQREENFFNFNLPDTELVKMIRLEISGKLKKDVPSYSSFVNMSFSGTSSNSPIDTDSIIYKDISLDNFEAGNYVNMICECSVRYYGGRISIFGGALDYMESGTAISQITVVQSSAVSSYKIDAIDASAAMLGDGRYISVVSVNKQGATSLDMLVKDSSNGEWRRIQNVVQPFSGETFSSVMIRSDKYSGKIYLSYMLNECLFIKPIDTYWLDEASDEGIVSLSSRFLLPDKTSYGLSGKIYKEIFNINDVRSAYVTNKIRIKPSFLVYGSNQQFLEFERASYLNAVKNRFNVDSGDGIEARMAIGAEYFSIDNDTKNLYSQNASESYSFEILPDGSLFLISIKDGGILMRRSGDGGITWKSAFSAFKSGVSCRPIKFLKSDVGSSIIDGEDKFNYINGVCPSIDAISTALDLYGQKMAIAYTIKGMIFLQEIPVSLLMNDCIEYLKKLFTTDQRSDVSDKDTIYPVFVAGSMPSEYVDPLINNQCDFAWRMAGPLSRENISAIGNISVGSKSPAMIYLSNGSLRMHFEGERGEIRAITINASTVRGDYLP